MKITRLLTLLVLASSLALAASCKKDDEDPMEGTASMPMDQSSTFDYKFNNGQVAMGTHYNGMHKNDLTATMVVDQLASGEAKISVTLTNTVDGEMYMIHAHDAADPSTTPNETPYNETPNSSVLTQMVTGNGGTVSVEQTTSMSYDEIVTTYNGFFVVHDPLEAINIADISTYLIVGTFARSQTDDGLMRAIFDYDFNTGQIDPSFAYAGPHAMNLSGKIDVQAIAGDQIRITVTLMNTVSGKSYMVHSHDSADPSTTPNGTPYNETPNGNVLASVINGNGGMASTSQISTESFTSLTTVYNVFFVTHDPLQPIDTTDPTTYVLLGLIAR